MNKLVLGAAIVVLLLAASCRSDVQVCEDSVKASQAKFRECTPDAGAFAGLADLGFSLALGSCAAAPKCQLGDGGTGTFDSAKSDKCTADIKAAACDSTTTTANCTDVCK
jgi:hypothetical protein